MKKNIFLIARINWIFLATMFIVFVVWNLWAIATDGSVWLYDHPVVAIPIWIVVLVSATMGPILNGLSEKEVFKLRFELDFLKALNKVLKK